MKCHELQFSFCILQLGGSVITSYSIHYTKLYDPGRTYSLLSDRLKKKFGGVFEDASDKEAFRAMHILAKMEGISVEPATGIAFAGLIKMIRAGIIKQDEVIVVNCTGHTMPIERNILGDRWARNVILPSQAFV